jgi:hypothetical protein
MIRLNGTRSVAPACAACRAQAGADPSRVNNDHRSKTRKARTPCVDISAYSFRSWRTSADRAFISSEHIDRGARQSGAHDVRLIRAGAGDVPADQRDRSVRQPGFKRSRPRTIA